MRGLLIASLLICGIALTTCREGKAQDPKAKVAAEWPQFLGPQRNGISSETGLLKAWPADGPKEVWRTAGGPGMSGLAISQGHAVTLIHREGKQTVIALDARTGKPQWSTVVAPEYHNGMGNGPRATPAISGDQVFIFTGEGVLAALNLADGKPAWSHNVVKDLEGEIAEYGMASSPLVVGKQVIVTAGAPNAAVVAYDTKTGKLAWKTEDGAAGYSSPALLELGGRPQIVASTGATILGIAPETGSLLWKYPFETNYNCNIATPLAVKGQVFISAGENHGSVLLALKPKADQF
ncbi:MAG: alcohol dehydrogenase, partial [Planctomycetaceae bacterium]|nr:alcohol dehydrogenase [Planctomycetaceae bacterium]